MLSDEARRIVEHYLRVVDRLLPGRLEGFYIVGSTALDAYRPGRSDIDFVAVVDGSLSSQELRRLRLVHLLTGARSGIRAIGRRRLTFPGTCNGVFVDARDLNRPVTEISPLASHTGTAFAIGQGFDVNPVGWHVLANHGIAMRGLHPSALDLQTDDALLRAWTRNNLDAYWAPWARAMLARRAGRLRVRWRWLTAWGVLGTARMHHTIATGNVIPKEAAGEYAHATFAPRWHPLIDEALAYRRDQPIREPAHGGAARVRETGRFVLDVIGDARTLATPDVRALTSRCPRPEEAPRRRLRRWRRTSGGSARTTIVCRALAAIPRD
jgi:aminoglycoside adenylyltransferase-like protein/nucleotidyltransferase-like protein